MRCSRLRILVVGAALGTSACATTGADVDRATLLLSSSPAPTGRSCRLLPPPSTAAGVDQFVDSVALRGDLVAARGLPTTGYVLLSVAFDENGWNVVREVIESDLSYEDATFVQSLVFAHVRTQPPGRALGGRLRIDLRPEPAFRLGSREFCPPRLRARRGQFGLANAFDVRSVDPNMPTTMNSVVVTVALDHSGAVSGIRFDRQPIRLRNEAPILSYIRQLEFEPALLDGIPVASTTEVPIRIR